MIDNRKSDHAGWRVSYLREVTPFASFQAAISYADGLANNQLVKQIEPETKTIVLVKRDQASQSGSFEFQTPRSVRDS